MKKLNVTFCSYPDFSGNARALYDYMKKTYKDKMNYTWIITENSIKEELLKNGINAILIGTKEFKNYIKKTDVFFTTHCNLTGDKPEKAIYVELWHGLSSKKLGYMVNNISEDDLNWYKHLKETVDYFIVPSEFWKVIFASRFGVELDQILPIGYPKLDKIKNKSSLKNLNKVLECKTEKYSKILYYMPTFRKGCGRKCDSVFGNNILNLKKYNENKLIKYLEDNNYLLCIKKHPSEESTFLNDFQNHPNIRLIQEKELTTNNFDLYDILDAADILITDYSSLGVEFLYLDKPVVYIATDIEIYMKNRGICYNDFDFWSSGTSINSIDEFVDIIDEYSKNNYINKSFSEKKKLFFGNLKDGGCSNICSYFFDKEGQLLKNIKPYNSIYRKLRKELKDKDEEKKYYERLSIQRKKELDLVYNSKSWMVLEKIRKLKNKLLKK